MPDWSREFTYLHYSFLRDTSWPLHFFDIPTVWSLQRCSVEGSPFAPEDKNIFMRKPTKSLIGFMLIILGLVGCSAEPEQTLNVKATVDAAVAEALEELPLADSPLGTPTQAPSTPITADTDAGTDMNTDAEHADTDTTGTGTMHATATASPTPGIITNYSPVGRSGFTITSTLCSDAQGPDCNLLRLGDDYLTTTSPAKGYLYSCMGPNPNAPGATESKITWIDFSVKTWDFFKKLWLPEGAFEPDAGTYAETTTGNQRVISVNGLPVDGMIGDWPMTNYPELTGIDRNPGIPAPGDRSFTYSTTPKKEAQPHCVSLGAIGVTTNGVVIYNAADGRGEDAVAREIVDVFGGHPAQSDYHYHFIPERLDHNSLSNGHSGVVGYINDGFAIYGYRGVGGVEMSNDDLDLCHGHSHDDLGYHYHATIEYPYTVGCYKGTPSASSSPRGQPQGMARNPRPRR